MNPRLVHLELTEEDLHIWGLVLERFWPLSMHWYAKDLASDRRDADLMFSAQRSRSYTFPVDMPPLELLSASGRDWIASGGALEQWKTLNLDHFA